MFRRVRCQQHIIRKKAMEALDEGKNREMVAQKFKIGKATFLIYSNYYEIRYNEMVDVEKFI
ncbi:hypothetical protein [Wolbachia pipientis]|uniref:hypothetical protein n=1 Tax=Wolbachia pipientis TaxID=955 RepID=UPI0036F2B054